MKHFGVEIIPLDRVTILRCSGALVDGAATTELHRAVTPLLPVQPNFVLALSAVEYVDSFGLGVLTRLHLAVQNAGGRLTVCAVPAPVARVLSVTGLADVFEIYPTEREALAAFAQPRGLPSTPRDVSADVFCIESSPELLAFVRQVLTAAGVRVRTANNLADGLTLLRASRPGVLLIGAALRQAFDARTAADGLTPVIELPAGLRTEEPAAATEWLLQQVHPWV